jgi:hypothetical protein
MCVYVCPAIRFRISQRILSKLGANIPWVMTRCVGYICLVCTQCARVRANRAHVCVHLCLDGLPGNILRITTSCMGYILWMFKHRARVCERACESARVRARAWLSVRSSLDRLPPNVQRTYEKSPQVAWAMYFFMFKHRARECESACVSARVIKRSLIFGRILSKFADAMWR